jgi:hypothetical protein
LQYFVFNGDDIFLGENEAIVALGDNRLEIRGLKTVELKVLIELRDKMQVAAEERDSNLIQLLRKNRVISLKTERRETSLRIKLLLRSKIVRVLCRPMLPICEKTMLVLLAISGVISLLHLAAIELVQLLGLRLSALQLLAVFGLLAWTSLAHELGHGAFCLKSTGNVGWIKVKPSFPFFKFAVDVSPSCRLSIEEKIWLSFAGPSFQLGAIGFLFALTYFNKVDLEVVSVVTLFVFCRLLIASIPINGSDAEYLFQVCVGEENLAMFYRQNRAILLGLQATAGSLALVQFFVMANYLCAVAKLNFSAIFGTH